MNIWDNPVQQNKRRPFPSMPFQQPPSQPLGLDLQPQAVQPFMPMNMPMPMSGQTDPNDPISQLASMGTKRLMQRLFKSKDGMPGTEGKDD